MKAAIFILLLAAPGAIALSGCESSPAAKSTKTSAKAAKPSGPAPLTLDGDLLIERAQLLRDREFKKRPTFVGDDQFSPPDDRLCSTECRAEQSDLREVMFGGDLPDRKAPVAYWDTRRHAVVWDRAAKDEAGLQADVVVALVEGLSHEFAPTLAPRDSWDQYLALAAVRRGPGVFVAALHDARGQASHVDAASLATRPEVLGELPVAKRYVERFAAREGFAFTSALYRAGGWSGVELARNEWPKSSAHVVRPDRYLAGEGVGEFRWPTESTEFWQGRGLTLKRSGTVGPAVFVEWLGQHIPASVARTAYLGWQGDSYRLWRSSEKGWRWEWVSMWNTPSTAQQIVEVLDGGFRRQDGDGRYTVLRKGATVVVVGSSDKLSGDELQAGPVLADLRWVFRNGRSTGIEFVATPMDRLASREPVTSIAADEWTDSANRVSADLTTLNDWKITPTTELQLPWFAKHPDGSIVQWHVEPRPLLLPPFEADEYEQRLRQKFAETVTAEEKPRTERVGEPGLATIVLDVVGTSAEEGEVVQTRAWQFRAGDFIVTLSLQSAPEDFDARLAEVTAIVDSIKLPAGAREKSSGGGIIKFEIEE